MSFVTGTNACVQDEPANVTLTYWGCLGTANIQGIDGCEGRLEVHRSQAPPNRALPTSSGLWQRGASRGSAASQRKAGAVAFLGQWLDGVGPCGLQDMVVGQFVCIMDM